MFIRVLYSAFLGALFAPATLAQPSAVSRFLASNCVACHSGAEAAAGLDLDVLAADLTTESFEVWERVHDRVAAGEMPPADSDQPSAAQRELFIEATADWLAAWQKEEFMEHGRVPLRRLTNLQLERTLQDLLGIDVPLTEEMPEEPRAYGFPTVASGQIFSHFQMQNHLEVVDLALDEAFRRATSKSDEFERFLPAEQIARTNPRRRCREPEMLDAKAVVWQGRTIFYGRLPATTAPEDGWYQLRIRASGLNVPPDHGVWCTVRSGRCVSSAPRLNWSGCFSATEEPQEWTFVAWLRQGEMFEVRPNDRTMKQGRFAGGQIGSGEGTPQNLAGLAIHDATFSRVHKGGDDKAIRRILFGTTAPRWSQKERRAVLELKDERATIRRLLMRFGQRAFRRPTTGEELKPYVELAFEQLDRGNGPMAALRTGYRTILCSPRFMYFQEQPGRLDDYALASRLSYFLWNSMPDRKLMAVAASDGLTDTAELQAQVERMLSAPRGVTFIRDFAHHWLDLKDIDFTEPDRRLYPGFDSIVQQSMLNETHAFLDEMLENDLSVSNLVESRFTYLNNRLARHYSIDGVLGDRMQKVSLRPQDHRGGLLTHGAVLKVTANGTTTSPVVRGVWVSERILGTEISPPPDSVPAIEPDIRGATTIRELLHKHQSDESCARCHRMIDPPGFALENFDPAGRWRTKYGGARRSRRSREVDASGTLADGSRFQTLKEFQHLMGNRKSDLAGNLARHLITYGTGRPCEFTDRPSLQQIIEQVSPADYGIRSIVRAVVISDVFRSN